LEDTRHFPGEGLQNSRLNAQHLLERLTAIVDSATDAIISTDTRGIIETWNGAAARIFRYPAEEILDQSIFLIIPPDLHDSERTRFERISRGDRVDPYETTILAKGGDKKDVAASMSPIRDSADQIVGVALVMGDVELRQQQEIDHARLAAIVESSDDAIISKSLNGVITSWNAAAERMFGHTADEIIGRSILTIIPPELQHEEPTILSEIRAGNRVAHFETQRLHKSGKRIDVSLTSSPIRDRGGRIIGASKIVRDISTRRHTDYARLRLAAIVESSDDAIISKNLDSIITSWNAGAERMFGYRPEEIIGQSVMRLMPRDFYREEPEIIRKLRKGERIQHFETKRLRKNGEIFDVSLTVSPVRDDNGHVIGASKIVRDISDRKATQAALMDKEKLAATGRLAASLAHEVNNPLAAITNLAYLIQNHTSLDSDARGYADALLREAQRAADIAHRTLSFYKEATQQSPTDVPEILRQVLDAKQKILLERNIKVVTSFSEMPTLHAYRGELRQVFENLIDNAVDAVGQNGFISVRTRTIGRDQKERLVVAVCDSGSGIAPDIRAKIFDPFVTTKEFKGSGLGLWVSHSVVHKHRGTIRARSSFDQRWKGTTFLVSLPVSPTL
jgi:PAS domain S-box-containing protein